MISARHISCLGALALCSLAASSVCAQISDDMVRIGFISDMAGLYADYDGPGGAEAMRMAIPGMGGSINEKKVELIVADHQNKADIAAGKAREWSDTQKLDMLVGGTNSAAALAMASVSAYKKWPYFAVGSGASTLTNERCPDSTSRRNTAFARRA